MVLITQTFIFVIEYTASEQVVIHGWADDFLEMYWNN